MAYELMSICEAAAILQPVVGELNAHNWLADMRRVKPVYRARVFAEPTWLRHNGRIMYPRSEILRLIDELVLRRALRLP